MKTKKVIEKYEICADCLYRQGIFSEKKKGSKTINCFICSNLFEKLDTYCSKILNNTTTYQYKSFLIGVVLPHKLYDREDRFRSKCRIRGKENIKVDFSKKLRNRFAKISGKNLDLVDPDISITVIIDRELHPELSIRSKSLVFSGNYKKKNRDVFSSSQECFMCNGKGCDFCNFKKVMFDSPESIVKKIILFYAKCDSVTFSPSGKEDNKSLVLGKGRYFHATAKNPRVLYFKKNIKIAFSGLFVKINKKAILHPRIPQYVNKIRAIVSTQAQITKSDLKVLNKSNIMCVEFNKKKVKINWCIR